MLKKGLIICFLSFVTGTLFSQNDYYAKIDSLVNDESGELRLKHVLRQEFGRISKTNSNGIIGNFLGISTKDNTLDFAYNFVLDDEIIEINASSKVSDGISTLFSNNEINTGVGIGIKYSKVFGQEDISINFDEIKTIQIQDIKLKNEYELYKLNYYTKLKELEADTMKKFSKLKRLNNYLDSLNTKRSDLLAGGASRFLNPILERRDNIQDSILSKRIFLLEKRIDKEKLAKQRKIQNLTNQLNAIGVGNITPEIKAQFALDTLEVVQLSYKQDDSLKNLNKELLKLRKKISENVFTEEKIEKTKKEIFLSDKDLESAVQEYFYFKDWDVGSKHNKYVDDYEKNLNKFNKIRARDIKLNWFSIGANINQESYTLFDPTVDFSSQINNESDLIPSLQGSYSYFLNTKKKGNNFQNNRRIRFFTIGGKLKFGNNTGSLKKIKIETTDSIALNRYSIKADDALIGEYKDNQIVVELFTDYYLFTGNKDNFGFHLSGNLNIGPFVPITSIRGGVIFAALKKDDTKSIVNFELFYGLNDIFKAGEEQSLLSRNFFGIQTTFPFNFKL